MSYGSQFAASGAPADVLLPQNFKHWRRALARVRDGSGFADVHCYGDSTTWGVLSLATNPMKGGYPAALQAILNSYHVPAAEGWMWAQARVPADTRWTLGTGWATATGNGPGDSMGMDGVSGAAGVLALAPGFEFDSFQVAYAQNPSKGSTTVNVDGGASLGTIAATGANAFVISPTYSVTLGTHTINILGPTGGDFFVIGIRAWNSTVPVVRVSNGGAPSTKVADWIDNTYPFSSLPVSFAGVTPDLVVLNLTINDSTQGTAEATWMSGIETLITTAQTNNVDVLLVSGVPSNPASYAGITAIQQTWAAALRWLAQTKGCGFLDLVGRWTDWPTSNTLGFYSGGDSLHPNQLGYTDCAEAIFNAIRVL